MTANTFFPKTTSINFTVKNPIDSTKTITIFGYTLFPGHSKDLLEIPEISEADIRHSLIKGDLLVKLKNQDLVVLSSTIDLMQFDPEQQQLLIDLGVPKYGVRPETIVELGESLYLKLDPIEDDDAPNESMYIAEDGQLSFKNRNGEFGPLSSGSGPSGSIQIIGGSITESVYDGNVVIIGDARLTKDTTINGNLNITGTLINTEGWQLDVKGNVIADTINFNPVDISGSGQKDLHVYGDLFARVIYFQVQKFTADAQSFYPTLYVNGDFFVDNFIGDGYDAARGLFIEVKGNLVTNSMSISGGVSTPSYGSGNGGNLTVGGNLYINQIFSSVGGDHVGTDNPDDGEKYAGSGGQIVVNGNILAAQFSINGGSGVGDGETIVGHGGSGGTLTCVGDASVGLFTSEGGRTNSGSADYLAGAGGQIEIKGSLRIDNGSIISCDGGDRAGNIVAGSGTDAGGHAGSLTVWGDIHAPDADVRLSAGDVISSFYSFTSCGNGGNLIVKGNHYYNQIYCNGGVNNNGSGGNAGNVTILGSLISNDGSGNIDLIGGNAAALHDGPGHGGNGGSLSVFGDANLINITAEGGSGWNGSGGNGGSIAVHGKLHADFLSIRGANCQSINPQDSPGASGNIYAMHGFSSTNVINAYSGTKTGSLTASGTSANGPHGGNITVENGDFSCNSCNLNGGSLLTDKKSGNCSAAGTLTVNNGNIYLGGSFQANGGGCNGGNGGKGGTINASGLIIADSIEMYGGNAQSDADDVQGNAGVSGNIYAAGGIYANSINLYAGTGTDAGESSILQLGGNSNIGVIGMDSTRPNSLINSNGQSFMLTVQVMLDKITLNNSDNSETSALGQTEGGLSNKIYKSDGGNWFEFTGIQL